MKIITNVIIWLFDIMIANLWQIVLFKRVIRLWNLEFAFRFQLLRTHAKMIMNPIYFIYKM